MVLAPVAMICFLIDYVLTLSWSEWNFTAGPVLIRSTRFVPHAGALPDTASLQQAATSFLLGRTKFRDFGAYTYAFRRSFITGSGVLNGVLEFNPEHHTITLLGRLPFFSAGFLIAFIIAACLSGSLEFVGMAVLVLTVLLLHDFAHMQHVLAVARRVWSETTA